MKRLSDLPNDAGVSGVYVLAEGASVISLEQFANGQGLAFFLVDGKAARSKHEFLNLCANSLGFPEYFGNNWDAFEECLTDLSWHDAAGYLVLLDNFEPFLEQSPDDFRVALQILEDSAAFWSDNQKVFVVLFRGLKNDELHLPVIGA